MKDALVATSKFLSLVLRHRPDVIGISLIWRREPPDAVFRVAATVPFRGRGTQVSGSLDR